MSSVFQSLEKRILDHIKKRIKLGSLTVDNLKEICKYQRKYLDNIADSFGHFTDQELSILRDKYLNTAYVDSGYKVKPILLDLKQELKGNAGLYERKAPFRAAEYAADKLRDINEEVSKNAHMLIENKSISIEGAKISDIAVLGILRETDLFINYTSYLWDYFSTVLEGSGKKQPPYRGSYLVLNQMAYMEILENVCDKKANYSFIQEIKELKKRNADLLLYANGNSFMNFFQRHNYTASDEFHVRHGVIGFNILAWIVSQWESWKYAQYKKTQKHKDWLTQEEFRLKQILNNQDPKSPEAERTRKLIEAYSAEISKLDAEIADYEKTGVE